MNNGIKASLQSNNITAPAKPYNEQISRTENCFRCGGVGSFLVSSSVLHENQVFVGELKVQPPCLPL